MWILLLLLPPLKGRVQYCTLSVSYIVSTIYICTDVDVSTSLSHAAIFYAKINLKDITVPPTPRSTHPFSSMRDCNLPVRHFE